MWRLSSQDLTCHQELCYMWEISFTLVSTCLFPRYFKIVTASLFITLRSTCKVSQKCRRKCHRSVREKGTVTKAKSLSVGSLEISLRKQASFFAPGPSGVSRETPFGPGAKKDGCFRRLLGNFLKEIGALKNVEKFRRKNSMARGWADTRGPRGGYSYVGHTGMYFCSSKEYGFSIEHLLQNNHKIFSFL